MVKKPAPKEKRKISDPNSLLGKTALVISEIPESGKGKILIKKMKFFACSVDGNIPVNTKVVIVKVQEKCTLDVREIL